MKTRYIIIGLIMLLGGMTAQAQKINIGGNVYGGGNAGDTGGSTTVTVCAGDIRGKVFGGARMADVGGSAFVHIDGEHASSYILINQVYGGNDISGTIGTAAAPPTELTGIIRTEADLTDPWKNAVDKTWNAFVRISTKTTTDNNEVVPAGDAEKVYIGELFGGGNGGYTYTKITDAINSKLRVTDKKTGVEVAASVNNKPELDKTYLEIVGGSIVYAFGGGNEATVTENTVIYVDNPSAVVGSIIDTTNPNADEVSGELLTSARLEEMGFNLGYTFPTSDAFQIGSFFGGNNVAEMAIRPTWKLKRGMIRNLYSGGNQGAMTYFKGILLPIQSDQIKVDNVYGGCRMADVNPGGNKTPISPETIDGVFYPGGHSARLYITAGDINNVYGGNDISGNIYGGNAVGIHTSIKGDVYGGGNGSYPYTDNSGLKNDRTYGDLYYNPDDVLRKAGVTVTDSKMKSVTALNLFRPNAESVTIRIGGDSEENPVTVGGAVYCGGNSATISSIDSEAKAQLKIGSYVIVDEVYLGNNGENMVKFNEKVEEDNGDIIQEGVLRTYKQSDVAGSSGPFSTMNLEDKDVFEAYMDGVMMRVVPNVIFDSKVAYGDPVDYIPYKAFFGSFYCGGNRGSIYKEGAYTIDFNHEVVIFNKLVGGSNDAYVEKVDGYNAAYNGGLLGSAGTTTGNKLVLNLNGLKIEPKRWRIKQNDAGQYVKDENDNYVKYADPDTGLPELEWNTVGADGNPTPPVTSGAGGTAGSADLARRFVGGNIYGGCYNSGHVNGNVVINIDNAIINRDEIFDEVESDELGEDVSLYGESQIDEATYNITERHTGVILGQQGMDVLGSALNVFGGGYGPESEIWGSTTINMNQGYAFQVFGGGEQGAIGQKNAQGEYTYDPKYSCYVNLRGGTPGVSKKESEMQTETQNKLMAECEFMYGGGFLGTVAGNTYVNLGNGRIFNSFAGSCNADVLGHTETYVGRQVKAAYRNYVATLDAGNESNFESGFPYVRDYLYGGNDLGGEIKTVADLSGRVRNANVMKMVHGYDSSSPTTVPDVLKASAYVEYRQGHAKGIFGGCYGTYDYTDPEYREFFTEAGVAKDGYTKPYLYNAFVNFRPDEVSTNVLEEIYGGAQGYPGETNRDKMQSRSYVLIDVPETSTMRRFENLKVFGAGAWGGLGMKERVDPGTTGAAADAASAIIDLMGGSIDAVYGASYKEGFTRRTVINVPNGSTIKLNRIFGGGYGESNATVCDAYETNVNYHSEAARVGTLYGGNNQCRRTLYGQVTVDVPAWSDKEKGYMTTVYGAGRGVDTWSQYTEVNLNSIFNQAGGLVSAAKVYEVYGGGENGKVMNKATEVKWASEDHKVLDENGDEVLDENDQPKTEHYPLDMDGLYTEDADDGLNNPLVSTNALEEDYPDQYGKFNTNVHIHKNVEVLNYAFAGGKGTASNPEKGIVAIPQSGDVYGTTYIGLLGGKIGKDIYGAGSVGAVLDNYHRTLTDEFDSSKKFVASTHCYVRGGTARNAYGGGWQGNVGYTGMEITETETTATATGMENDTDAETHIIIGIRKDRASLPDDYGFYNGVPAIQRNAYGGGEGQLGEGGAVYGTTHLTLNNGYIGYVYENGLYDPKLDDETWSGDGTNRLRDCGNVFGGGYSDKSSVDNTELTIWGGTIRSSLYGGGEIATVGRGSTKEGGAVNQVRQLKGIYKTGSTKVTMYNGHVLRNVFGGGKGYNLLGYGGEHELYTDGYVFGNTEVYIHGGEIGTEEGVMEHGYGNVFGGGDRGYVYSKGFNSTKTTTDRAAGKTTGSPSHYYYYDNNGNLTEDCKVVVAPYLQVKPGESNWVTYGGKTYKDYEYVPTDYLNTLPKKDDNGSYTGTDWLKLYTGENAGKENNATMDDNEERGIHIRNAVFGGGNVSSNSDTQYANATTVFGNTTATLYDIYHRDFITVGTEHTGGLYGGGNLSVVDGYRELNITNYGTDYYGLKQTINIDEYRNLSNRERAYFQLEYECTGNSESKVVGDKTIYGVTIGDVFYEEHQKLTEEEYLKLANSDNQAIADAAAANFEPYGFCSIYAGRLLNTIQRADLCGVYGSRMVLQGAKDRVAEIGEDIDYTINRVGELSLNQKKSLISTDTGKDALHGNYFGIYSGVNYLGNLTSDVHFSDEFVDSEGNPVYVDAQNRIVTTVKKANGEEVSVKDLTSEERTQYGLHQPTYYSYKAANPTSSSRNKGNSFNQVALASGVFLELTTEETETSGEKVYGYITGVVELDLINVKRDNVGGGFVYAKNEHREGTHDQTIPNVILSEYNKEKMENGVELRDEVRTYKRYVYTGGAEKVFETSGNFIHPTKRIIDDCYPVSNSYELAKDPSVAHYWYIKGDVYVYEQKVSAYTGSANAYSKEVHLPLTITAASNGKLRLINVKPNLYAYKTKNSKGEVVKIGSKDVDDENNPIDKTLDKVTVNNESDTYGLNDVITWWDWHQMTEQDRSYFVAQTYVNCVECKIGNDVYAAGTYVMDETDFETFKSSNTAITNAEGEAIKDRSGKDITDRNDVIKYVFRSSNNIGHDSGYVLTFDMDSPADWDDYYTNVSDASVKITKAEYQQKLDAETTEQGKQNVQNAWREGPTFTPKETAIYGKHLYSIGDIVTEATRDHADEESQSKMEPAYVATKKITYTYEGQTKTLNKGAVIPATEYGSFDNNSEEQKAFAAAKVCTNTVKLGEGNYMLYGDLKTQAEIDEMIDAITQDSSIPSAKRTSLKKEINDALTNAYVCTVSGEYGGETLTAGNNYGALQAWCSLSKSDRIDDTKTGNERYKFTYNYDALDLLASEDYLKVITAEFPATDATANAFKSPYTDEKDVEYKARFVGDNTTTSLTCTVNGETKELTTTSDPIDRADYERLTNDQVHYTYIVTKKDAEDVYIAKENFIYLGTPYGKGQVVDVEVYNKNTSKVEKVTVPTTGSYYYCYETFTPHSGSNITAEKATKGNTISVGEYNNLKNDQKYFVIQGMEPTERTTLYVSRESDIYDLTKEKIITVVYQYTYYDDEDDGSIKMTNELHVVNIHLELESGAPQIGLLSPPAMVLPGDAVGLKAPDVNPGIYEVLTNSWEIYDNYQDALNHRNGVDFVNSKTPVYWYQNQQSYVAFYSKTILGKTYSNPVPVSVANYHDIGKVMAEKEHHMYIDRDDVDRPCKIYINDYSDLTEADSRYGMNGIDELKNLFNLSTGGTLVGHAALGSHIENCRNLEFYLRSNIDHSGEWTPIAPTTGNDCFAGNLHGDGHTVTGLTNSLFGSLCGNVYNLGVTGTFTTAGVADTGTGYVENCWVKSDADAVDANVMAVFGNPTRENDPRGLIQMENCYYPANNHYKAVTETSSADDKKHGYARAMSGEEFYNGEVAYDLNGFYLKKRYYQGSGLGDDSNTTDYKYLLPQTDGTLAENALTGYYPNDYALYQPDIKVEPGQSEVPFMGYVEERFYDGDYRFAGGTIPETADIRMRTRTVTVTKENSTETETKTVTNFYPIWPDDYLFFGQRLNYGHMGNYQHQNLPSTINRVGERIQTTQDGNRVYRAPAYFGSKQMTTAHFNPYAVFAESKSGDATVVAYKGMTAIDFTGGNGDVNGGYKDGFVTVEGGAAGKEFYPPLLDDDGLTSFHNVDLTPNLLVYTEAPSTETAGGKTGTVVSGYLQEKDYTEDGTGYRLVAYQNPNTIRGHWVKKTADGRYVVDDRDHQLVDKKDFNCPIAYTFSDGSGNTKAHQMWYQREPELFAGTVKDSEGNAVFDSKAGWEGISLPFSAEIVTTHQKGELTHFYRDTDGRPFDLGRMGHEYWLRAFTGISEDTEGGVTTATANFTYPQGLITDENKVVENTFLWDYYYKGDEDRGHHQKDKNDDTYQTYYSGSRTYPHYPRLAKGTPYIIGFPGQFYYEFDMSGEFRAITAAVIPLKLVKQTVTFASAPGATIGVSDDETVGTSFDYNGHTYTFMPSYKNVEIAAGTDSYTPGAVGSSYDKVPAAGTEESPVAATPVVAFRPYFTAKAVNGVRTRSIIFSNEQSELKGKDDDGPKQEEIGGTLDIYAKRHKIIVESSLDHSTDVRIVNTAGITVSSFTIEPGETVETRINTSGVYIVQPSETRFIKKLVVR